MSQIDVEAQTTTTQGGTVVQGNVASHGGDVVMRDKHLLYHPTAPCWNGCGRSGGELQRIHDNSG